MYITTKRSEVKCPVCRQTTAKEFNELPKNRYIIAFLENQTQVNKEKRPLSLKNNSENEQVDDIPKHDSENYDKLNFETSLNLYEEFYEEFTQSSNTCSKESQNQKEVEQDYSNLISNFFI